MLVMQPNNSAQYWPFPKIKKPALVINFHTRNKWYKLFDRGTRHVSNN